MNNPFSLLFIVCRMVVSSFTLCNTSFFTRSIEPNFSILVQQHISKLLRFLVQSPKGPSFSNIQSYAPNVAFHEFLLSIEVQSADDGSLFPAECDFAMEIHKTYRIIKLHEY